MRIKNSFQDIETYIGDTSNISGNARLLYFPESADEVSQIVQALSADKTPFTICAGRTGTTGGCVPQEGALIAMDRLDQVREINPRKSLARLEAGVTLAQLAVQAAKSGLILRASPTESLACIAGAAATAASGVRGFGYGSIRDYLLALDLVLPTGESARVERGKIFAKKRDFDFKLGGKKFKFRLPSYNMPKVKTQAGYFVRDNMDLIDLFIGSEGTLGVIAGCDVLLQKIPSAVFDGLVFFDQETQAFSFVDKIIAARDAGKIKPASLEFLDANSLRLLKPFYPFVPECQAAVYFEQESGRKNIQPLMDFWSRMIEDCGADIGKCLLADNPKDREKIFEFRHKLPQIINEFLRQARQVKTAADIAVPRKNFSVMYAFYRELAEKSGVDYLSFGHIGESHLHFNFLPRADQQGQIARGCIEQFCRKAVELGGTVSAEHGIGKLKKAYLGLMYGQAALLEMAALKKVFDPDGLLGRDNIFDKELLNS